MKYTVYCVIFIFLVSVSYAQNHKKQFLFGNKNTKPSVVSGTNITYMTFSNSIGGPFTSDLTLTVGDSLFIKADVAPLGSVQTSYFVDVNENRIIDSVDILIGMEVFYDNNTMPPGLIDLDTTAGTIISFLDTEIPPSMSVIVKAAEGEESVYGFITFENQPALYTLSGHIYDLDGYAVRGAWIFLSSGFNVIGDASDTLGLYSIPANAGTYDLEVWHVSGMYGSFDTTITITGNMTLDFTLSAVTSYIRGYVRDENSDPIRDIEVWSENGNSVMTDTNGMYILMVPGGAGQFGLNDETTLPDYLNPQTHFYTIGESDSIVNNSISNFTCYSANSTIIGQVLENGSAPSRPYRVSGWSEVLQSSTWAISDPSSGNYVLHVHSGTMMPMYSINIAEWDDRFPWPSGYYPDTMYSYVSPNTSGVDFNFIPAETLFADPFTGDIISPDWAAWSWFSYGSINYGGSGYIIDNNRLRVNVESSWGTSGIGIMTNKPFRIAEREYRVYVDNSMLVETNNSVRIMMSDIKWFSEDPGSSGNSLQLIYERNESNKRQWRLMRTIDGEPTDLWTSADSTGHHILFQFITPDTLVLKINGVEDYRGPWGNHLPMAYVYLAEFSTFGETSAPVYFDEFFIGPIGTTSVREIEGPQPGEFLVRQNYPNPFNPVTFIQYELPMQSQVVIDVYNILGQLISTLVNQIQNAGIYKVSFDGNEFPSGIYYYKMKASDPVTGRIQATGVRKAILIK